ncbi:hypothetical protein [Niastella sp. OAS944]|uniref:hypothetical protein n=1 Tax=Niastella sp. OAS944 TaxID=2664089 RepID=UPI0035C83AFD|nr:hypothetical protein [Chitinophagaceae bacterium OAS944]
MHVQLLKIINGPRPKSAIALIIQDDGSLENPGQVILDDFSAEEFKSNKIFYNGDSIYDLWVSPAGDIWACSSFGNVYTTADVNFPDNPIRSGYNLDHDRIRNSGYNWKMYTLDAVQNGVRIWSPDGVNIFVGTYSGHVYLWNGTTWTKQETPTSEKEGKYIYHFAGTAVNNVFAIGNHATELHHYNGTKWEPTAFDRFTHGSLAPSGLLQHPDGFCYLACEGGRIWKTRDGQQFELVVQDPELNISSMAYAHDKIIIAAGEKGVFTIQDEQLVNLRNTFNAVQVSGSGNQAVFIRPEKESEDKITVAYAVYCSSPEKPWLGYSFHYAK